MRAARSVVWEGKGLKGKEPALTLREVHSLGEGPNGEGMKKFPFRGMISKRNQPTKKGGSWMDRGEQVSLERGELLE